MCSKKLTEEEAFKLIQGQSVDFRKSMRKITSAMFLAGELDQQVEKHRWYQKKSVACDRYRVKESPGFSVWKAHCVSVHFVQLPARLPAV